MKTTPKFPLLKSVKYQRQSKVPLAIPLSYKPGSDNEPELKDAIRGVHVEEVRALCRQELIPLRRASELTRALVVCREEGSRRVPEHLYREVAALLLSIDMQKL